MGIFFYIIRNVLYLQVLCSLEIREIARPSKLILFMNDKQRLLLKTFLDDSSRCICIARNDNIL